MEIETHQVKGIRIAEVKSDKIVINSTEDMLDLLGDLYFQDFDKIILHQDHIIPEFFDLKTGLAGEILQKFSNYRVSLAIVGDFTKYTSKSVTDFICESNRIGHVNFVGSGAEAINILSCK